MSVLVKQKWQFAPFLKQSRPVNKSPYLHRLPSSPSSTTTLSKNAFAPYPINVGLLNRFRSAEERRDIQKRLATGELDVVVGTHQLLGKGVGFRDLGLLVVDEEQRFGVNQKEKIKSLKTQVDVLTLSATPIPRTLYMSLVRNSGNEFDYHTAPSQTRRLKLILHP